jgi:hypothetical protein
MITMFLSKISEDILVTHSNLYVRFRITKPASENAIVIQLYEQGKTRRQIAEVVHMSFKDIADVIKKHIGEDGDSVDKPVKTKDTRAFETISTRQTIC